MRSLTIRLLCPITLFTLILESCAPPPTTPITTLTPGTSAVPTIPATLTPAPTATGTQVSLTNTFIPPAQSPPIPVSGTPTVIALEDGLIWSECALPNGEYTLLKLVLVTGCVALPDTDVYDARIRGERIERGLGSDLRLVIGQDAFLAKHVSKNAGGDYEFLKNGKVVMEIYTPFYSFDPNRNLWNIGGKPVWELIADPPVIIVDGVDFNEKYQLEGSFFPYEINGKLLYIAKKDGKYHIVYDGHAIGPEFDAISMAYCCATISVVHGHGRYWFLGMRQGTQFAVVIHP
jgi:hypothetical protein